MLASLSDPDIWTALLKIAVINVVLSGDNAVVIALACRGLSPAHQRKAFIVGAGGIVVLMTILTACAAMLMTLPWIQAVGSVLLIWIGIKLLLPEDDDERARRDAALLVGGQDDHRRRHRDEPRQRARHGRRREGPPRHAVPRPR